MADKNMEAQISVEFEEATSRQSLNSGETINTLWGKVKRWFTDLKAVCFSGSYNDLSDTPTTATTDTDGLMSAEDKGKLDAFEITTDGGKLHDKDIATTDLIPTSLPANGGNADTVNNHTVKSDVPENAKFTDTTYSNMTAATASTAGKAGLVPAPAAGKQTSFLRGDGTWVVPTDTKYTHPDSGISAGTYKSVTVDTQGHVIAGTNPTTLAGYGITDAAAKSHTQASSTINAMTGYSKPSSTSAIATSDTLNAAIGKLEKALDGKAASSHTHSAYVNQNAFSNVAIGDVTVAADTATDTLTLVGSNVTLTPDATNDKLTIGITKANVTSALGYTPPTSNTDRYVNKAAFSDDSTNTAASPVKMTLTRAGSDTATVVGNIPKVSSSSAGVVPKGAAVSSQTTATKFLREDGTWAAPSYIPNTDTKVTAVGNHYTPAKSTTKSASGGTLTDIANSSSGTQVVTGVEMDAKGHVTGVTSVALKSTNTTYDPATQSKNGLMASTDKTKLDLMSGSALTSNGTTATTTKGYTYGVAGVTTSPYTYTKWYVYLDSGITTLTNGMIIRMKIPVGGCDFGVCITIDGTNFHPVVFNTNTTFRTHIGVNTELMLMYDSGTSANVWSNSTTSAPINGVWRLMNSYDYNSDYRVTQNNSTSNSDYRLLLSYSANDTDTTNISYKSTNFKANPSTGALYAKGYDRYNITGQTLDVNTLTLSAGSPHTMHCIEKTAGGAANITNIPLTGQPFILDVELIRWGSVTDYITLQTFTSISDKNNIYRRWCNSGTWGSWSKFVGDHTHTPQSLGFGYGTCTTAETDVAKVATLSGYNLVTNGVVSIKFSNNVPASATLNINNRGAKPIYQKGAAIDDGIIRAGDTATFIYNGSQYHLISVDRMTPLRANVGAESTAPTNGGYYKAFTITQNKVWDTCDMLLQISSLNLVNNAFVPYLVTLQFVNGSDKVTPRIYCNYNTAGYKAYFNDLYFVYDPTSPTTDMEVWYKNPNAYSAISIAILSVNKRDDVDAFNKRIVTYSMPASQSGFTSGLTAKSFSSLELPSYYYTQTGCDMDNLTSGGTHVVYGNDTSPVTNGPVSSGAIHMIVDVYVHTTNWIRQIAYDVRSTNTYTRSKLNGTWSDWVQIARVTDNVASATKLATARTIDGMSFNGTANITHYATCSTAAATAAKTVSLTGFTLATGAKIAVKFTVTNTAANPTLNVNNTGAKSIYYRGAAISAGYLAANRTYEFIYNGTQYELVGDLDSNTDTKVTNTLNTTAKAYVTGTTSATTNTGTQVFDTGVYLDTTAGQLVATTFKGDLSGTAENAIKIETTDSSGNPYTGEDKEKNKVYVQWDGVKYLKLSNDYNKTAADYAASAGIVGVVNYPSSGTTGSVVLGFKPSCVIAVSQSFTNSSAGQKSFAVMITGNTAQTLYHPNGSVIISLTDTGFSANFNSGKVSMFRYIAFK